MKNPTERQSSWETRLNKSGTFVSVLAINFVILLLVSGVVVYHFVVPRTEEPIAYIKLKSTPPPPKPPSMSGRQGSTTKLDPAMVVAPPPAQSSALITSNIALPNFSSLSVQSVTSVDLPQVSLPQGTTLDQMNSADSGVANESGSNPFGSTSADDGPALVGYLYDLKRSNDGSPTDIKDDGYFKDRTLEHTYEARWHWGPYIRSFANDPQKKDQLADSMLNEAKVINTIFSGRQSSESLLEPYFRSKPLFAYQWSIGAQTPANIVKAFGVENEVKPAHLIIFYKGTVIAPRDGTFRFVCFSQGGAMSVRFNNELVAGHANWENPLISGQPFYFPGDVASLLLGETAGKWFQAIQGQHYPVEILLTAGDSGASLHLMIEEKQPAQPYPQASLQWDTLKQRANPRITLRYPLFALRPGVAQAPFIAPSTNPPPAEAPADVQAFFEKNGPYYKNPEVAPDPIIFPGSPD